MYIEINNKYQNKLKEMIKIFTNFDKILAKKNKF